MDISNMSLSEMKIRGRRSLIRKLEEEINTIPWWKISEKRKLIKKVKTIEREIVQIEKRGKKGTTWLSFLKRVFNDIPSENPSS